jgi:nucleoside-diphosphate-sugar epimerase
VPLFLVTGGAGFIGSHIVRALVARGDRVRVLDDFSSGRLENLSGLDLGAAGSGRGVEVLQAGLLEEGALVEACRGAAGIFHEAAQVSVPASLEDPVASYETNVMGTLAVLEAARAASVPRIVFAASSAAYGDDPTPVKQESLRPRPLSPYASGKLAGEALLEVWGRAHGLHTVALRYFNVYGPGQADDSPYSGVIALFARAALEGRAVTIHGDGEQTRDFVFVEDVARANLQAMDADLEPGTVLNVGTGRAVSIKALHAAIGELAGGAVPPRRTESRAGDVRHSLASIDAARRGIGFEPAVSLEEGLRRTLTWYRREAPARPGGG